MKKKTGKRFFFHENPKTMAEEALHSMSSHDNGLTSPTTSEVVPSFEKRKNKRERKRERQREREFVATYLLVCIILKVVYV